MDFNTYTYRPGAYETAMPLEIASWACYAKLQKARRAYGLYDLKNDGGGPFGCNPEDSLLPVLTRRFHRGVYERGRGARQ